MFFNWRTANQSNLERTLFPMLLLTCLLTLTRAQSFESNIIAAGNITYTLNKVSNPTSDQADAYVKIQKAMDSALFYYNQYTTLTKRLTVNYEPGVQTADANFNGNIRFGSNRSYMAVHTAMHEIAHAVGIGTTNNYKKLISGRIYTGVNGTQKIKELVGDTAKLHGDSTHFWPYGLNYASEVKSTNDLVRHCLVVEAMIKDMFPSHAVKASQDNRHNLLSIASGSGVELRYTLSAPGAVMVAIYSLNGREVVNLQKGVQPAGVHSILLNEDLLLPGRYVCRFGAGEYKEKLSFIISR